MKTKLLILYSLFFLLQGCSNLVTKNPSLEDLQGIWESTGPIAYFMLSVDKNNNGHFVIIFDEKEIKTYRLEQFKSLETKFSVRLVDIEGKEKPQIIEGTIFLGKLAINDPTDKKEKIWFMRTEDLSRFRKIAKEKLTK